MCERRIEELEAKQDLATGQSTHLASRAEQSQKHASEEYKRLENQFEHYRKRGSLDQQRITELERMCKAYEQQASDLNAKAVAASASGALSAETQIESFLIAITSKGQEILKIRGECNSEV